MKNLCGHLTERMVSEIQETAGYKALNEKYADDFKQMSELLNDTKEYDLSNMWTIFDNVDCHKYNNFTGKLFLPFLPFIHS